MVWIAGVLAVFLFYQFVERSHKIIAAKAGGALCILGALAGLGIFLYDRVLPDDNSGDNGISVKVLNHVDTISSDERKALALKQWESIKRTMPWVIDAYANEDRIALQGYLLWPLYDSRSKVTLITREEMIKRLEANGNDKGAKQAKAEFEALQSQRVHKLEAELANLRGRNGSATEKSSARLWMTLVLDSITDENEKRLKLKLSDEEIKAAQELRDLKSAQGEILNDSIDALDRDAALNVEICNKKDAPLKSYHFYVSGLRYNRSTKNPVVPTNYGDSTKFAGDIIIPAQTCTSVSWTAKYKMFHTYEVSLASGVW